MQKTWYNERKRNLKNSNDGKKRSRGALKMTRHICSLFDRTCKSSLSADALKPWAA